jgi:tetratricopeptide (TPR) repeat protein
MFNILTIFPHPLIIHVAYLHHYPHKYYTKTMPHTPNVSSSFLQHLAHQAYAEGNLKLAFKHTQAQAELDQSYETYLDLGLLAKEISHTHAAIRAFNQAIKINPLGVEAYIEKCLIYYETDRITAALKVALLLKNLLPQHTPWALLAVLYAENNQDTLALFYAEKALQETADATSYHARALIHQQAKRFPQAERDYRVALLLNDENPDLWLNFALLYEEQELFEEALTIYTTAMEQGFVGVQLFLSRAKVHQLLGYQTAALRDCAQALSLDPHDSSVWHLYAYIMQEGGAFDAALHSYNLALKYEPDDSSIHMGKGSCLELMGQTSQAFVSFDHALQLNPLDVEIRLSIATFLKNHDRLSEALVLVQDGWLLTDDPQLKLFIAQHTPVSPPT